VQDDVHEGTTINPEKDHAENFNPKNSAQEIQHSRVTTREGRRLIFVPRGRGAAMGIFATRGGAASPTRPGTRAAELTQTQLAALPPEFVAVGEALVSGSGAVDACEVLGHRLAVDGVAIDEALSGLTATFQIVLGRPPSFAETRALSVAWGESILGYVHRLSCEDPVTGLATMAHLQSRLAELYRAERSTGPVSSSHALVVLDLAPSRALEVPGDGVLTEDLRAARVAETIRSAFAAETSIGRLARHRLAVLTPRDAGLGRRVALLRRLLAYSEPTGTRLWIEGLPATSEAAAATLAELARL
jgi:GGDEF domain-containing protein